jgi:hypothetical protein
LGVPERVGGGGEGSAPAQLAQSLDAADVDDQFILIHHQ